MDGWSNYLNKKVFIRTLRDRTYSGVVTQVDDKSIPLIFITIIDKYKKRVTLSASEIVEIKEEDNGKNI